MQFPKYRGTEAEIIAHVQMLCDHLSNNGPIPLHIKFGVGRLTEYDIVDVRTSQWREGIEVMVVFQLQHERDVENAAERHMTIDQPMLVRLLQQAGYKWGDAVLSKETVR